MRKSLRFRWIAKWSGLASCALILAAWLVSPNYVAYARVGDRGFLGAVDGCIFVGVAQNESWLWGPGIRRFSVRRDFSFGRPQILRPPEYGYLKVIIPFWVLLLLGAVP